METETTSSTITIDTIKNKTKQKKLYFTTATEKTLDLVKWSPSLLLKLLQPANPLSIDQYQTVHLWETHLYSQSHGKYSKLAWTKVRKWMLYWQTNHPRDLRWRYLEQQSDIAFDLSHLSKREATP